MLISCSPIRNDSRHYRIEEEDEERRDVYLALGQTDSGRYLAVFYILKKNRVVLPISARDMDDKERRRYGRKG